MPDIVSICHQVFDKMWGGSEKFFEILTVSLVFFTVYCVQDIMNL